MEWLELINSKIYKDKEVLKHEVNRWKTFNDKVVFTNGCFDILHQGHLDYLSKAADLGDRLIIGVNSDRSVSALKGEDRPIIDQESRALKLASLVFVDAVIIFDEDTPLNLIKTVLPDVLVKGGDYKVDTVVGAEEVIGAGGEVKIIPFLQGHSTTAIINKINGA